MSEVHLTLTTSERDLLVRMLTAAVKEKRVEVRRSEFSRDYRHEMEAEEAEIEDVLNRLTHAADVGSA